MPDLLLTLKTTFGYASFRPLQREIMEASLAGRDVFALLPTGGGKSLCFQIPALHREGLTVVVSPLIALMKDQVDQLQAAGVAATYLNSSLGAPEARSRLAGLHRGEWRLLYVSPERLMLDNWQENLKAWNVAAIAIDEAHCISEWGHDFRPEYRQLSRLRELLPEVPVMALTATATERVREDIHKHLKLKNPAVYTASFNRPNLTYKVIPKDEPLKQILEFVKRREDESGIVYCSTRATTERLAESLASRGYSARTARDEVSADQAAVLDIIAEAIMELRPQERGELYESHLLGQGKLDEAIAAIIDRLGVEEIVNCIMNQIDETPEALTGLSRSSGGKFRR